MIRTATILEFVSLELLRFNRLNSVVVYDDHVQRDHALLHVSSGCHHAVCGLPVNCIRCEDPNKPITEKNNLLQLSQGKTVDKLRPVFGEEFHVELLEHVQYPTAVRAQGRLYAFFFAKRARNDTANAHFLVVPGASVHGPRFVHLVAHVIIEFLGALNGSRVVQAGKFYHAINTRIAETLDGAQVAIND